MQLRYLSAGAVAACLPPAHERVDLAASALTALARGDAEMPPKIGVHPRPGALLHAMPAWLRTRDLVGMKWIAAFPENRRRGLAAINGLIVLNDADTGVPTWIVDAGAITAHRTAAVSGVALRLFAGSDAPVVTIIGAGVQGRSHLDLLSELLPAAEVRLHDRHPQRAASLAEEQNAARGAALVRPAENVRQAVGGAAVVITVASLQKGTAFIDPDWLAPGALVVAVDFASSIRPAVALAARVFATDDRAQFLAYRDAGYFDGYPDPGTTLGELLESGGAQAAATDDRPVLVTHLGVGLADVIFADAIARQAERHGAGLELPHE